jgi:hypothetical protein
MSRPLLIALLVASAVARDGLAAEPEEDACARARELLGAVEPGASAAQCQQALDAAEEERWQLWLDIAAADEIAGDHERAALSLHRFVVAADRRGLRLPAHWVVVRDEARATIARLDADILRTRGRVTLTSIPEGAEARFSEAAAARIPDKSPRTPVTAYFDPGSHSVRLLDRLTDRSREVSFTLVAGGAVALVVDLRPGVPPDRAIVESRGEAVLGQRPVTGDIVAPPEGPPTVTDTFATDDFEGPPIREPGPSPLKSLGAVAIAAGTTAIAVGTVFALLASGMDDEAACRGEACDSDRTLREAVRRDADVHWARATGSLVAGGVLVAGGIVALLLDDGGEPETAVRPWVGPGGAGVGGRLRF